MITPVFRVVYHTGTTLIANSRIACGKHVAPKAHEIVEQVIDETWDSDLFCDDCLKGAGKKSRSIQNKNLGG